MDLIAEINAKYQALEAEVDRKLEKVKRDEEKLEKLEERMAEKSSTTHPTKILTYEEAMTRNTNLLKSLEMAKARLRSRSTFSPVEQILERAIEAYKRDVEQVNPNQSTDNENVYEVAQTTNVTTPH